MDNGGEANVTVHTRLWTLQPESEYRFELDPGATLAIKVRLVSRISLLPTLGRRACGEH